MTSTIRLHKGDISAADAARYTGAIAIDTETLGLVPRRPTTRPQLPLPQRRRIPPRSLRHRCRTISRYRGVPLDARSLARNRYVNSYTVSHAKAKSNVSEPNFLT